MGPQSADRLNPYQGLVASRESTAPRNPQTNSRVISQFWELKHSIESPAALFDLLTISAGNILYKNYPSSMAHSSETRTPIPDVNVISFAYHLQRKVKKKACEGENLMRQFSQQFPEQFPLPPYWDRPNSEASMPMVRLLRGDLKDRASNLLSPAFHRFDSRFDQEATKGMWKQHRAPHEEFSTESLIFFILLARLHAISPRRTPLDCTS